MQPGQMPYNPYMAQPQRRPSNHWLSQFVDGINGLSLRSTLSGATKTISKINQVLPIIGQAKPLLYNTKNAMRIMKAVKKVNSLDLDDLDEIDEALQDQNEEEEIEDAVIVGDEDDKEMEKILMEDSDTKKESAKNKPLFDNRI